MRPVVLLGLNPGFKAGEDHRVHANPAFAVCLRANLAHGPAAYPLYAARTRKSPMLANPGENGGTGRWARGLRTVGPQTVSRGVLCVEYFPYHSKAVSPRRRAYTRIAEIQLLAQSVGRAIDRGATVIMLRGKRFWLGPNAVPELAYCPQLCHTNSVRNPTISERNCPNWKDFDVAKPH